jgi:hypothetical protein
MPTSASALSALLLAVGLAAGALMCSCRGAPDQDGGGGSAEGQAQTSAVDSPSTGTNSLPKDSLSEEGWQKLDHALRLLLRKGPDNPFFSYQTHRRDNGTVAYGVLIRTTDPPALSAAGLPVGAVPEREGTPKREKAPEREEARPNSGAAQVVTVRLTPEEIRRAARMGAVVSISNPAEAGLH